MLIQTTSSLRSEDAIAQGLQNQPFQHVGVLGFLPQESGVEFLLIHNFIEAPSYARDQRSM
jgi:hypothetical protein